MIQFIKAATFFFWPIQKTEETWAFMNSREVCVGEAQNTK